ncbi:hypothetical protein SAY87_002092 [Trapa incisa]|uniref:Uncharacterized protein n=1 Tax=Trapa incisa TaxID=236973 RepID=A0AAN7JTK0_9MYRT|nr:hypothetical protein SAY87_002092 [Trapa incisa]
MQSAPRTINVQKFSESRASELESLHSVVAHRLGNDFRCQRNKRRRTTSHESKSSKRRRKRQKCLCSNNPDVKILDKPPRHIRRRNELRENPQSGFSMSNDGTKRLRTHVWHAKRFTMTKLWGFHLPLGLHGRGKGSRALLTRCKEGAVVHDASYHFAVQVEGPEDSLISILKRVLVPSPDHHPIDMSLPFLCGATYKNAMLHHIGEPTGRLVAPVVCIWRPIDGQGLDSSRQIIPCYGQNELLDSRVSNPFRQLWVWMHASSFGEGYNALKTACQVEMDEKSSCISCFSVDGRIAKIEVIGSSASELLEKILHPISLVSGKSFQLRRHSEAADSDNKMKNCVSLREKQLPDSAVLSLVVQDPRLYRKNRVVDVQMTNSKDDFTLPDQVAEQTPIIFATDNEGPPSSSPVNYELGDLWDVSKGIRPPVEESVICQENRDRQMEFLCLRDPNSRTPNTMEVFPSSRICPIMLLRRHSLKYPFLGWSIILPLSWVKAFWVPLVTVGGHAMGLREQRWISSEAGIPCFPYDFPDCNAYTSLMAMEAAASGSKADLQPPKLRPMKIPIPSPWNTIKPAYDKVPFLKGDSKVPETRGIYNMRTSHELCLFNKRFDDNWLLFPHGSGKEWSLENVPKKQTTLCQDGIIHAKSENRLHFLRVTLRAFREGVFEGGAVVCAPRISDISLWTSRPDDNKNGLQIPDSAVASYFSEESSGEWVLQTPADPQVRESHRQPIGFVTSGFVRGSKKPMAVASCEATSLAQLRADQWMETSAKQRKKEIYVLVRNLRSSAYRLALATIVLEHQDADVESI